MIDSTDATYDYDDYGELEYADYYTDVDYHNMQKEAWSSEIYEPDQTTELSFREIVEYCVVPTASDSSSHLTGVIIFPAIFLLCSRTISLPKLLIHLASILTGGYFTWIVFGLKISWIAGLSGVILIVLIITHFLLGRYRGPSCLVAGAAYFAICELWIVDPPIWHAIRGIQMVLLMKLVSLGFDIDSKIIKSLPNPFEILGYAFHPGTVIFGPWVTFSAYRNAMNKMKWTWQWFLNLSMRLVISLSCLLFSTCFISWLMGSFTNKYAIAYREALSFRASHYFVSYLSEVAGSISGLEVGSVCQPLNIEIPRSLVDVVVSWNIPMHTWLKKYVFKSSLKHLGPFLAILVTYATSALFHGLNFQLAAVLLSLGFYTYTEHSLRRKLSYYLNACVEARACPKNCDHTFKGRTLIAMSVNILFCLLTIFGLAYLGMMFDSSNVQEDGYNMSHTLNKWNHFNFSFHWIALTFYIVDCLI